MADGPEGSFVDQVGQVRTHGSGSGLGDFLQVHVLSKTNFPGVDLQGVQTALEIGPVHHHPPVETAGPQQGLIQYFGPVGGGQTHDALGGVEAVDLAQQLVQGLLVAVIAHAGISGPAHGVDLVDEDDAGGHLGGFLEQVPHPAGTHAHEHFLKIRAGNGEEGDARFSGHGLGKQGLTGTRRAHQQRTLGQLGADVRVFLGIVQEVDDFLQGFLGFVLTGHVLEGHAGLLFHVDLGGVLVEAAHHAVAAETLGDGAHHQENHGKHNDVVEDHDDGGVVLHDLHVHILHAGLIKLRDQGHDVSGGQAREAGLLGGGRLGSLGLGQVDDAVRPNLHFCQLSGVFCGQEVGVGGLGVLGIGNGVQH